MRNRRIGWACAVVAIAGSTLTARAAELTQRRFVDWTFYNNAGWRAAERGELEKAAERFMLAIDVLQPEWDRAPRLMAHSYADLAWTRYRQGRFDEAEPFARWALEVRTKQGGPATKPTAQSLYELAMIQDARSEVTEAEELLRKSIAVWETCVGPYDIQVTFHLGELARFLIRRRKFDEAEAIYRRILGQPERALQPTHPYRLTALMGLGRIYTTKGEPIRAQLQDTRLIRLLDEMPASQYKQVAGALSEYIAELQKAGQAAAATRLKESAQAVVDKTDPVKAAKKSDRETQELIERYKRWEEQRKSDDPPVKGGRPPSDKAAESRSAYTPPLAEREPRPEPSARPER